MLLVGELNVWKEFLNVGNFFFDRKNITILILYFLFFVVSDKVRRDVASIKLQTIHIFNFVM